MPKKPNRKLICQNSVFKIFFQKVKSNDGKIIPDYLIISPKQKSANLVAGVSVLPVVNGKFALLRIYRHAISADSWEIPRGFVDKSETSTQAVIRELEEETGLECRRSGIHSLGIVTPEAGIFEARTHLFVARNCKPKRSFSINELGHREFRLVTDIEIRRMIKRGDIQDQNTLVCFYRYSESLKKGRD